MLRLIVTVFTGVPRIQPPWALNFLNGKALMIAIRTTTGMRIILAPLFISRQKCER